MAGALENSFQQMIRYAYAGMNQNKITNISNSAQLYVGVNKL